MKKKNKEQIIKEFSDSLEFSLDIADITYKRLMLEILVDLRDIEERKKLAIKENVQ